MEAAEGVRLPVDVLVAVQVAVGEDVGFEVCERVIVGVTVVVAVAVHEDVGTLSACMQV